VRGRDFALGDDVAGAPAAVVVNDAVWRSRLAANPAAIGRPIDLGPLTATVIGIAAPGFHGPRLGDDFDVWLSFGAVPAASGVSARALSLATLTAYARLRKGVTVADADAAVRVAMDPRPSGASGRAPAPAPLVLRTLAESPYPAEMASAARNDHRIVILLSITSGILLVIGFVNLAGLEISRAERRRHETAVRLTLGASKRRLACLFIGEAALPIATGGVLAILAARACLSAVQRLTLPSGVSIESIHAALDVPVVGFIAATCGLAACLVGLVPMLRASGAHLAPFVGGQTSAFATRRPVRAALLAAHAALSVVLLVGAGLFVRTLAHAFTLDLGFAQDHVVSVSVQPRLAQYASNGANGDLFRREAADFDMFLERLRSVAGMTAVARGPLPLAPAPATRTQGAAGRGGAAAMQSVGPGYARAAGLILLGGRDLTTADVTTTQPVPALVSYAFAEQRWPGGPAVGRVFPMSRTTIADGRLQTIDEPFQVVGVVRDASRAGVRGETTPVVYRALALANGQPRIQAVVRVSGPAETAVPAIRRLASDMFPNATSLRVRTAADVVADDTRAEQLSAWLLAVCAGVAIALALIGVFGLVSLAVASRRVELGIRMALGAPRGHITRLVGATGFAPLLVGGVVGLGLAAGASRTIASSLFGVSPLDPVSYLAALLVLAVGGGAACYFPALRIRRINPADTLRAE
jgi:predicted permease